MARLSIFSQTTGSMERWWRTCVIRPGAPGENLEERDVAGMFGRCGAESLDIGGLKQLGEDVCVWSGSHLGNEISGSTWGRG